MPAQHPTVCQGNTYFEGKPEHGGSTSLTQLMLEVDHTFTPVRKYSTKRDESQKRLKTKGGHAGGDKGLKATY